MISGDRPAVVEITAADTHDLRRRVLRENDPTAALDWPGDHDVTTFHLGVRGVDGTVLATSTWLARPDPDRPDVPATQLRGMATQPAHAGTGLGSALLTAGTARCRARGDAVLWANARFGALDFYERAGFRIVGPAFTTADTGLPHRRVRLELD